MDIFDVLTLIGGLALFLFGMNLMGDALEKRAGNQLKNILEKLTSNKFKGFLLGAGVTSIIQSSSATTVMVVGFVNSGIMSLKQAIGIIMGANVGTTITAWILSLTGIESSNVWVSLLKPTSFTPILALVGLIMVMSKKNSKRADTGMILLGFAVLMFGMEQMSGAVSGLRDVPEFRNILIMFSNPVFGVLAGAVLTGIIQSSSASVGILQALATTGAVNYGSAIPIIMGQNIGTCVTAIISSIGANKNARRTAVVHLSFNIIGTLVWLTLFCVIKSVVYIPIISQPADQLGIAIVHTAFNVLCTLLLFPFANQLEKLACIIIKDTEKRESLQLLDERLMTTPAIAIDRCKKVVLEMFEKTSLGVISACNMLEDYDSKVVDCIMAYEQDVDKYEDKIGTYLVRISTRDLSERDSKNVSELLHIIGDIERISDHSVGIAKSAEEIHDKKIVFSQNASKEISVLVKAVKEILEKSKESFENNDMDASLVVDALEEVIDNLKHDLKKRHIDRLKKGECTIEHGFIMTDILTALERISDHCANIAECVVEIEHDSLGIHAHNNQIDKSAGSEFNRIYTESKKKYTV